MAADFAKYLTVLLSYVFTRVVWTKTKALIIPFPQKGNGILFLCGFIFAIIIIPFPQKGNGILFLCGFIFAIIIIRAVVVVVVKVGQISLFF